MCYINYPFNNMKRLLGFTGGLVKNNPRFIGLLSALLILFVAQVSASERFWLPRSYQSYMPQLIAAANAAEQTERCVEVLQGSLATDKPGENEVQFLLTCRDDDKRSYNLRYAYYPATGAIELTHEQKSQYRIEKEKAAAKAKAEEEARLKAEQEALEKMKADIIAMAEAEAKAEAERQAELSELDTANMDAIERAAALAEMPVDEELAWESCLTSLKAQTRNMKDLDIETEPRPESKVVHEVEREFEINFQAKNPQFRVLNYRAYCHVWQDGRSAVKIKARRVP